MDSSAKSALSIPTQPSVEPTEILEAMEQSYRWSTEIMVKKYKGKKSKQSPSKRSAEGAERRDSFICCGAFGAAGAEGAKNTSTAQEHQYSRSSPESVEASNRQHKAPNTQHMARIYDLVFAHYFCQPPVQYGLACRFSKVWRGYPGNL